MKEKVEKLKAAQAIYAEKNEFSPGQIVTWKDDMKNKTSDGPFVVIKTLDRPEIDQEERPGSPYYRENLDILLGTFDRDGDFVFYHFDSARMRPLSF